MEFETYVLAGVTNDLTEEPKARQAADAIELQIGAAKDPIKQMNEYSGDLPLIASSRLDSDDSNNKELLDLLSSATEMEQVEAIDIDLVTVLENTHAEKLLANSNQTSIVSYRNLDETPNKNEIGEIIKELANYGDVARFEAFAHDTEDVLAVLSNINKYTKQSVKVSGTSLGQIGKHSRTIAHKYGSKIGYGRIDKDRVDSELGEFDVRDLARIVREVDNEDAQTQIHPLLRERFQELG